jgi:hypothetical protein
MIIPGKHRFSVITTPRLPLDAPVASLRGPTSGSGGFQEAFGHVDFPLRDAANDNKRPANVTGHADQRRQQQSTPARYA